MIRFDRVCVADTEVKGTKVPKGMVVVIPVHALNNDPEVWPNPEQYDPERY
jgi:cytochrome P450 family 3 subfamily A